MQVGGTQVGGGNGLAGCECRRPALRPHLKSRIPCSNKHDNHHTTTTTFSSQDLYRAQHLWCRYRSFCLLGMILMDEQQAL